MSTDVTITSRPSAQALADLYRDLHRNPELSFAETRTAGIVAASFAALGYEVTTGIGGTGVVGILRRGEGPTVLLRADMDALPVARGDRPRLRQHCPRHGSERHGHAGDARLRPRRARHLPAGCCRRVGGRRRLERAR